MAENQNGGIRIVVPQHSLKQKNKGSNKEKEILDQTVRQIEDSLILNGGHTSTYDRDRKNLSNAAHVSNALKNEDHRRTLENNIQKSLHNTLQLNNLQLQQETLNNSISNHNSQSIASSEQGKKSEDPLAKVQIKSVGGVRNQDKNSDIGGTENSNSNNSNKSRHIEAQLQKNLNTERIPQITSSVQQIKPQFSPHLPTAGGHNAMNMLRMGMGIVTPINDLKNYNFENHESIMRCKLSALYRLVDLHGWSQSIYNHITVKVSGDFQNVDNSDLDSPSGGGKGLNKDESLNSKKDAGNSAKFLINPFGLLYHEISASKLLLLDSANETIINEGTSGFGFNRAGWTIHAAVHRARPEVKCVIHIHTAEIVTCSINPNMLTLPLCQEACILGPIALHRYNGIVVDRAEQKQIEQDLGKSAMVMLLENHGAIVMGRNVEEAWHYLYHLMIAAKTQVMIHSTNLKGSWLEQKAQKVAKLAKKTHDVVVNGDTSSKGMMEVGVLNFEAQMRALDDMGYRTGYPYRNAPDRPTAFHARLAAEAQMQQILAEQKYTTEIIHTTNRNKNTTNNPQTWACLPNRYEKKQVPENKNSEATKNPSENNNFQNKKQEQQVREKQNSETKDTLGPDFGRKQAGTTGSNSNVSGNKFEEAISAQLNSTVGSVSGSEKQEGNSEHVDDSDHNSENIVKTKWELANDPETNKAVMTSQGPIKIQPNHLIPVNTNRQDAANAYNAITSLDEQAKRTNFVVEKMDHFAPKDSIPDRNNPFTIQKTQI